MNLLLQDNGDGGELVLEAGDLKSDETLLTALYMSLFSGDCYYNIYENYESNGEFEEALSQTITANSLKITENKAINATKWMIDEGIADSIEVKATGDIVEKQNVSITITEPSGVSTAFGVIWQNERLVLKAS